MTLHEFYRIPPPAGSFRIPKGEQMKAQTTTLTHDQVISTIVSELNENITRLSLEENAVGRAARKVLRMKRDGVPKPELMEALEPFRAAMNRLFSNADSEDKVGKDGYLHEPIIVPKRQRAAA